MASSGVVFEAFWVVWESVDAKLRAALRRTAPHMLRGASDFAVAGRVKMRSHCLCTGKGNGTRGKTPMLLTEFECAATTRRREVRRRSRIGRGCANSLCRCG